MFYITLSLKMVFCSNSPNPWSEVYIEISLLLVLFECFLELQRIACMNLLITICSLAVGFTQSFN